MKVSPKHLFRQGPVIGSLLKTIASAVPLGPLSPNGGPSVSRRHIFKEAVPPRDPELIRDYIRHVGGDPAWYRGVLPSHMFPQWGFPLMAKTLQTLPYNLIKVLNGGCRIEINRPLPANKPLILRARLHEVKDDGTKAVLTQRLITGTSEHPEAIVSYVTAIVPLGKGKGSDKSEKKKERPRVPLEAREIARMKLQTDCGLEYAMVTGDFNPIHWIAPYARMSGFKNPILHGFSGVARTIESLNRTIWSGEVNKLESFEARFVRPLVLPASIGVYIDGAGGVFMGEAPGGPATLTGKYTEK